MTFFKGFRVESNRRRNFNYSSSNRFFVTINVEDRSHAFGEISDEVITYTPLGNEVNKQWKLTPSIRPDMNLVLDEFQVMPNHFHGIIIIGENEYNYDELRERSLVSPFYKNKFGPQRKNLSSIMRGFKSAVTTYAKTNGIKFKWQANFHDIVIKDDRAMNNIRNYIRNNVKNWGKDRFNRNKKKRS